ncbi:MAG: hypothetical protein ACRDUV_14975 [Pseudonocardiaceae bacterium]
MLLAACTSTGCPGHRPARRATTGDRSATPHGEQVVAELANRLSTAKPGVTYTVDTDPNQLLGRPTATCPRRRSPIPGSRQTLR